jgi:hypothetical protein
VCLYIDVTTFELVPERRERRRMCVNVSGTREKIKEIEREREREREKYRYTDKGEYLRSSNGRTMFG